MDDPRHTTINAQEVPPDARASDDDSDSNQNAFEALARIAHGDLTLRINGTQPIPEGAGRELLLNLDGLARRLRYIVGRLQRAADSIEAVVGEVLRGTQTLSAG